MGLSITVGMFADLSGDEEGVEGLERQFAGWNESLGLAGIGQHREPRDGRIHYGADMGGYSTLHYLRRVAAQLWERGHATPAGDDDPTEDPSLLAFYDASTLTDIAEDPTGTRHMWNGVRAGKTEATFNQTILFSDAEGCYLPIPFDEVLVVQSDRFIDTIGSVSSLMSECKQIARTLPIPPDILRDDEETWAGLEDPSLWGGFGREAHCLAVLLAACRESNKSGAAVIFH